MTKIKISALVLLCLTLTTISCTNDNNNEPIVSSERKESLLLQKKYDFESLYRHIDKSSDKQFITSKNLNKLTKKTKTVEELDLTNVTEIDWKGENITYLIPFLGNSKKYLILLVEENSAENIDFSKGTIVDHEVDSVTGSGTISIFTEENYIKQTFEDGIMTKNSTSKPKNFRQCFDQAYNDICDGFVGCASWYSSPLPALTAIAYCGATT